MARKKKVVQPQRNKILVAEALLKGGSLPSFPGWGQRRIGDENQGALYVQIKKRYQNGAVLASRSLRFWKVEGNVEIRDHGRLTEVVLGKFLS